MRQIIQLVLLVSLLLAPSWTLSFNFHPAGLTPKSSWYFLEIAKEEIVLFFTFSPVEKINKIIDFSTEKLTETEEMWQENNQSSAQKSLDRFRSLLQRIEDLIPSAQKEKNFLNKKDVWQEILAQELVFLIDNQDRDQVKDLINLVKETKKQLQ